MNQDTSVKKYALIHSNTGFVLNAFYGQRREPGHSFHRERIQQQCPAPGLGCHQLSAYLGSVPVARRKVCRHHRQKKGLYFRCRHFLLNIPALWLGRVDQALIAFRVIQGIGGAMLFGTSMAILTSVYPPRKGERCWESMWLPSTQGYPWARCWEVP